MSQWNPVSDDQPTIEQKTVVAEPVVTQPAPQAPSYVPGPAPQKSRRKKVIIIVAVILGVLGLCCIGSIIAFIFAANSADSGLSDIQGGLTERIDELETIITEGLADESAGTVTTPTYNLARGPFGQGIEIDGITFGLIEQYYGDEQVIIVVVLNESNNTITIPTDGGWSGADASNQKLEYQWTITDGVAQNAVVGIVEPGQRLEIELRFKYSNGTRAEAIHVAGEFTQPYGGYDGVIFDK
jgi:hypothetical protein